MARIQKNRDAKGLFDWAMKISPGVARLVFGGYLVLAVAAIVLSWRRAPSTIFATAVGVLVLAVVVALLTRGLSSRTASGLSQAFLWAFVFSILASLGLFISVAFFGKPQRGAVFVARFLDAPEIVGREPDLPPAPAKIERDTTGLPELVTKAFDPEGDQFERISALSERPSLRIVNATVDLGPPRDPLTTSVHTLDLTGGTIVTRGGKLIIEAMQILSDRGAMGGKRA